MKPFVPLAITINRVPLAKGTWHGCRELSIVSTLVYNTIAVRRFSDTQSFRSVKQNDKGKWLIQSLAQHIAKKGLSKSIENFQAYLNLLTAYGLYTCLSNQICLPIFLFYYLYILLFCYCLYCFKCLQPEVNISVSNINWKLKNFRRNFPKVPQGRSISCQSSSKLNWRKNVCLCTAGKCTKN